VSVWVLRVKVSPLVTDFEVVKATEYRKFPAVDASQIETCVNVSEPDAHDAHVGVFDIVNTPPDAAENVAETRVVFALAAVAPAAPGSAVCNFTNVPAGAVNAVPRSMFNHEFARFALAKPTVIARPPAPER
jgi:hypothetical protein